MSYIRTPYDELKRWHASGELDTLFLSFGATTEVTSIIPVSTKAFSNLRPVKGIVMRNVAVYHPEKLFVPKTEEMYLQNGSEYRIAVSARDVVHGSVTGLDDAFNQEFGYTNFLNVLKFSCDERTIVDGYFTLLLDANPRLQKKLPEPRF